MKTEIGTLTSLTAFFQGLDSDHTGRCDITVQVLNDNADPVTEEVEIRVRQEEEYSLTAYDIIQFNKLRTSQWASLLKLTNANEATVIFPLNEISTIWIGEGTSVLTLGSGGKFRLICIE